MTSTLNKTALDIIKKALLLCKAQDPNQSVSAEDRATCLDSLNMMIKQWDAAGYHLWTLEEAVLFLERGVNTYKLGDDARCCLYDYFIPSALSVAKTTGATTVTLDSVSGMGAAPFLLGVNPQVIMTNYSTSHGNVTPSGTDVFLTNSGGAFACETDYEISGLIVGDTYIFNYQYTLGTCVAGTDIFIVQDSVITNSGSALASGVGSIEFVATQTYGNIRFKNKSITGGQYAIFNTFNLKNKTGGDSIGIVLDSGDVDWLNIVTIAGNDVTLSGSLTGDAALGNVVYTYSDTIERPLRIMDARSQATISSNEIPLDMIGRKDYYNTPNKTDTGSITQIYFQPKLNYGELKVWQAPSNDVQMLRFTYNRPFEIFDNNASIPDFPSEWYLACAYNLAAIIAPEYKTDANNVAMLEQKAGAYLTEVLGYDTDTVSMFIQPEMY